jgi:predicted dienelactone hydrolase
VCSNTTFGKKYRLAEWRNILSAISQSLTKLIQAAVGMGFRQGRILLNRLGVAGHGLGDQLLGQLCVLARRN